MPRSPSKTQARSSRALICSEGVPLSAVTRPRIIGTSTNLASGACCFNRSRKGGRSSRGISRKKKLGARSGSDWRNCWRRLASIAEMATSKVIPKPIDRTRMGVRVPGLWILASASRNMVSRGRGQSLASAIKAAPIPRKIRKITAITTTDHSAK